MRKVMALLVALTMVLSLVAVPAFAAESVTLRMEIVGGESIEKNDTATLNVYLEGAADSVIASMINYEIAFDGEAFEATDVSTTCGCAGITHSHSVDTVNNKIKLLNLAGGSFTKGTAIQSVELKAIKNITEAENHTFAFAAVQVADSSGVDYTVDSSSTAALEVTPSYDATLRMDVVGSKSMKTDNEVTLNIYLEGDENTVTASMINYEIAFDGEAFEATDVSTTCGCAGVTHSHSVDTVNNKIKLLNLAGGSFTKGTAIQSVTLKAKKTVDAKEDYTFAFAAVQVADASGVDYMVDSSSTATLSIIPSFVATKAEPTPTAVSYEIGTDVAAELADDIAITVAPADGDGEEGYKATWVCEDETCDVNSIGEHIFVGTVVGPDDAKAATWEGNLTTTVTVFLEALKDGTLAEVAATEMQATKEDTDVVVEAFDLAITKGDFADAIAIAAEWIAVDNETIVTTAAATFEDAVTITIPADTASKDGKFVIAEETVVKADVIITPAEFPYEEVSYEVSASGKMEESTELTVTITNNQTEENLKPEAKAVITVTLTYGEGETATFVYGDDEGEEITFDAENKEVAIELPALSDMFDLDELGLENFVGASVSVGVTYDDADVKADAEAETPETSLEVEEDAPTSNRKPGGIGSSTRPSGNSGTVVTPGTDEPGTDEPGTDEPGTDAPVVTGTFSDVPTTHWAYEAIEALAAAGIINGVGDGTFNVDGNVTRAEFVKMLMGAMGVEATATESAFEDCAADAWYTPYVVAAAEAGYVMGMSETYFGAEELISRQDICTILGRVLAVESETAAEFTDADQIADYAVKYVNALVEMGIINGYEDGSFKPEANATRAEAAKIINGVLALVAPEAEEEAAEGAVVEEAAEEEATEEVAEEVAEEATEEEAAAEETEEAAEADAE